MGWNYKRTRAHLIEKICAIRAIRVEFFCAPTALNTGSRARVEVTKENGSLSGLKGRARARLSAPENARQEALSPVPSELWDCNGAVPCNGRHTGARLIHAR
jgi:hypothetical protein